MFIVCAVTSQPVVVDLECVMLGVFIAFYRLFGRLCRLQPHGLSMGKIML